MHPLSSHRFETRIGAPPGDVWSALTRPRAAYLHGLQLISDWTPGAAVEARRGQDGAPHLTGSVIAVEPGLRLTMALDHGIGDTATYVTWWLRAEGADTILELVVDEIDGPTDADAVAAWTPVLTLLRCAVSQRSTP
jgi:uncharacterized protein YndB with AHSA1/START domain